MAVRSQLPSFSQPREQQGSNRPAVICHNCSKPGHIAKKCWAKGSRMEGQGPKNHYKPKAGVNAQAAAADESTETSQTSSPMATYVMLANVNSGISTSPHHLRPNAHTDTRPRQNHPILEEKYQHEGNGVEGRDVHNYPIVLPKDCMACHGRTSLYCPPIPIIRTFLDSGALEHCWVKREDFVEYSEVQGQGGSSAISGEAGKFQIHGVGTVQFVTR